MKILKLDNLKGLKQIVYFVLFFFTILEMLLFPSWSNLYGCFSLIYGWSLISNLIKYENLEKFLLPTLAILGYGLCYCFLPLVVTLFELKPLTFNFQNPYLTFSNQIISITIIILSYKVCLKLYKPNNILNKLWNKIGYITPPLELEVWLMGWIGVIGLIISLMLQGNEYEMSSIENIIISFVSTLSIAPIALYWGDLYSAPQIIKTKKYIKYYIIFLIILGIASTRRFLAFNAVFSLVFIFTFVAFTKNKILFSGKKICIYLILIICIAGPLTDLATAMILNRNLVQTDSAKNTFESILELYSDKERLHNTYHLFLEATDNGGNNQYGWSEYYVDNIFLDRFCNLRTIDATLYNAKNLGFANEKGMEYNRNYWIMMCPSFITNLLGVEKISQGTVVDNMLMHSFNNRYNENGFKVGGETGIGLYIFGYWYYFIAFFIYILVFYFLASFVDVGKNILIIPIPILINLSQYFLLFNNANGIFTLINHSFGRLSLNSILLYCCLFAVIRVVCRNIISKH